MLTNNEKDSVFKHIVKKVKAEKSFLLNNVNREIKEVYEQWGRCPTVSVIYRVNFDRFYFESKIDLIKKTFHLDATNDVLVLTIPPKNKTLTMEELDKLINEQFTEINKALIADESIKIPDNISINDFDNLKFAEGYEDFANCLFEVGQLIQSHRLSIFDIDGKTAVIALAFWIDDKFIEIEDKEDVLTNLLNQFKIIILNSHNDWSAEFIDRLDTILDVEFNEIPREEISNFGNDAKELGTLIQSILSIKQTKASIKK